MKNSGNSKLPGKSTAAIICFCLAAVAALGIFSYNKASDELSKELTGIKDGTSESLPFTEAATEPLRENQEPSPADTSSADKPAAGIMTDGDSADDASAANAVADNIPMEPDEPANENLILEHDAFGSTVAEGFNGACVTPVSGELLVGYSGGELVKSKTLSVWKTHDGIDIAAQTGSAVRSAAAGVVTAVRTDPLMGVTVIIDHGSGYEGWYCNLDYDVEVAEGEEVNAGTVIGEVGTTADAEIAEEPHLHFGLKQNGSWKDPADFISGEGS